MNFFGTSMIMSAVSVAGDFNPASLFASSEEGGLYVVHPDNCYQDAAASTPAGVDDPVGYIADLSGNGNHLTQATAGARPTLRQAGGGEYYLEFDGTDDRLARTSFSATWSASTLATASQQTGATDTDVIFGMEAGTSQRIQFYATSGRNRMAYSRTGDSEFPFFDESTAQSTTVSLSTWDGSDVTTYTDGAFEATGPFTSPVTISGGEIYVGESTAFDTATFTGSWHGGLLIDRALTSGEQDDVNQFFAYAAGVTLP